MTKYRRLGGLNNTDLFPMVPEAGRPRLGCCKFGVLWGLSPGLADGHLQGASPHDRPIVPAAPVSLCCADLFF